MGIRGPKATDPKVRFWHYVKKSDDCWQWIGGKQRYGYGAFYDGARLVPASRFSWFLHYGPIPDGLCVLHHCDNPECTNPAHLFLGTFKDNTHDMLQKHRGFPANQTRCERGHPLSGDNVKTSRGRRECRECARIYRRKRDKVRWKKRSQTASYKAYQKHWRAQKRLKILQEVV